MLASLLCNSAFSPGPRKIKWRNRFGEFDTYEEAIAHSRQSFAVPVSNRADDAALVFILAHL